MLSIPLPHREGLGVGLLVLLLTTVFFAVRHQRRLRQRAHLMREAIRNRDFQFRLPTDGLLPGERAMQETLNQLGDVIRQQTRRSEVESWEWLTRVLTHEIMNATAPIASISQSMLGREDVKDTPLEEGVRAIHTAATHLGTFVDSYRKFSQLQQPMPEDMRLADVVAAVQGLYPDLQWDVTIADDVVVHTDPGLLRQVLINLTKNAVEAGARRMAVKEKSEGAAIGLLVSNDGAPIPAEARSSIFVPFFTTKKGGSGIGLSLSRRIMTIQGGDLELTDDPQTTFLLTF
ncbi:MAG: HAMP domain-containing histidine kinase [Bacteroidaceae bacterium]|nr:HAMP domain-containing histidine kinase [Bacteroidaceae bacterium]